MITLKIILIILSILLSAIAIILNLVMDYLYVKSGKEFCVEAVLFLFIFGLIPIANIAIFFIAIIRIYYHFNISNKITKFIRNH